MPADSTRKSARRNKPTPSRTKGNAKSRQGKGKPQEGSPKEPSLLYRVLNPAPELIKRLRLRAGLTQAELQEEGDIGPGQVSRWETGQRPGEKAVAAILKVTKVTVEEYAWENIEYLIKLCGFKNERELDLEQEKRQRAQVQELRELLAKNHGEMSDDLYELLECILQGLDEDDKKRSRMIRMIKLAIKDAQHGNPRRSKSLRSPDEEPESESPGDTPGDP